MLFFPTEHLYSFRIVGRQLTLILLSAATARTVTNKKKHEHYLKKKLSRTLKPCFLFLVLYVFLIFILFVHGFTFKPSPSIIGSAARFPQIGSRHFRLGFPFQALCRLLAGILRRFTSVHAHGFCCCFFHFGFSTYVAQHLGWAF